eukprot:655956_1
MNGYSQSSEPMTESSTVGQLVSLVSHESSDPLIQCTNLVSALGCCIENIPYDRKDRVLSVLKRLLKRTLGSSSNASQSVRTIVNFRSVSSPVKSMILSFLQFHEKAAFRGVTKWAVPVATAAIHNTESIRIGFARRQPVRQQEMSLFMSLVQQGLMRNLRRISMNGTDHDVTEAILRCCPKLEYFDWLLPLR